jgi:hypothetical protein
LNALFGCNLNALFGCNLNALFGCDLNALGCNTATLQYAGEAAKVAR